MSVLVSATGSRWPAPQKVITVGPILLSCDVVAAARLMQRLAAAALLFPICSALSRKIPSEKGSRITPAPFARSQHPELKECP